jgi:hypothetical protein
MSETTVLTVWDVRHTCPVIIRRVSWQFQTYRARVVSQFACNAMSTAGGSQLLCQRLAFTEVTGSETETLPVFVLTLYYGLKRH